MNRHILLRPSFLALCLLLFSFHSSPAQVGSEGSGVESSGDWQREEEFRMEEFENRGIDPAVDHSGTPWYRMMTGQNPNVLQVMDAYEEWFRLHPFQRSYQTNEYRKWIQRTWTLADAAGNILPVTPDPEGTLRYLQRNRPSYGISSAKGAPSAWRLIGPMTWDRTANAATGSMGIGVIRAVSVDPKNPVNILLGTVSAGIWYSTDRGEHWKDVTQGLLVQEVRDVAFAPSNPRIAYAASNVGVLKSTDGGNGWSYTSFGQIDAYPAVTSAYLVAVSPASPDILLCASSGKVYRSVDGGASWNEVYSKVGGEVIRDIVFHPTNSSLLYMLVQSGAKIDFLRSTDGGQTFSAGAEGYPVPPQGTTMARALLAVTPAAPNKVHVMIAGSVDNGPSGLYGHYVSWDSGLSFAHLCCGPTDGPDEPDIDGGNPNIFHYDPAANGLGQVTWDMGFAASDQDTNLLVTAGIFSWRSTDGGRSWQSTPGIHYDVQNLAIGGGTIWVATDGGIFRSDDRYTSIIDKSDGINTIEIWGFGQGLKRDVMAIGAYHLPIFIRDDGTYDDGGFSGGWYPWSGADAMGADVNPIDDRWFYAKPWTNVRGRRVDDKSLVPSSQPLGIDLGYIPLTNVAFHPHLYYTIFAPDHSDTKRFAVSRDNAGSWTTLKEFSNSVYRVRISNSNPDYIYGLADGKLWRTTDGGKNWEDASPSLSTTTGKALRDIVVSDRDERSIWLALGGYQNTRKMLRSTDAGETWNDVSGSLPKFEIRSMVYQEGSNGGVYVGTTLGIYYRNNMMADWELHGTGLPPAEVNFLLINYAQGKLRVGTSRGIWENDLYENTPPSARIAADKNLVACSREGVNFACASALRYGAGTTWEWSFPGGIPSSSTEENPAVAYPVPGRYSVGLKVTDQFGSDTQTLTDFIEVLPSQCGVDPFPGLAADLSASTTDYVEIPPMDLVADSVTFTAWIKPQGIQPDWAAIYMHDGATGFGFKNGRNELQYHWNGDAWPWSSGLIVPSDEWSHVALTVTPAGAVMYLNGVPSRRDAVHTPMDFSSGIARLGQDRGFGESRNFKGEVDEFRIYSRALTQEEVRETMHLTRPVDDPGLVLYYQFNETAGTRVYDRIGVHDAAPVLGGGRIVSTAPCGWGKSYRTTVSGSGVVSFPDANLSIAFPSGWKESEIVAWRLYTPPDTLPAGMNSTSTHYWIVRGWGGEQSFSSFDSLVFAQVGEIKEDDVADPSRLKLFRRGENEYRNLWGEPVATGRRAESDGVIAFGRGVTSFGQFLIGTIGSSTLSAELSGGSVTADAPSASSIEIYPNPVLSHLNLLYRAASGKQREQVLLYDGLGRIVRRLELIGEPGVTHGIAVDMSNLSPGVYLLRVGEFNKLVVKM